MEHFNSPLSTGFENICIQIIVLFNNQSNNDTLQNKVFVQCQGSIQNNVIL